MTHEPWPLSAYSEHVLRGCCVAQCRLQRTWADLVRRCTSERAMPVFHRGLAHAGVAYPNLLPSDRSPKAGLAVCTSRPGSAASLRSNKM